eukprot:symbB.v1.2.006183.t2/scaffold367.1/size382069/16
MLIFGQHCVKHNLIERLCFISKSKSDLASELPVAARLQLGGERGPLCTENTFLIMRKDPDLQLEVPNCRSAWQYFASDRGIALLGPALGQFLKASFVERCRELSTRGGSVAMSGSIVKLIFLAVTSTVAALLAAMLPYVPSSMFWPSMFITFFAAGGVYPAAQGIINIALTSSRVIEASVYQVQCNNILFAMPMPYAIGKAMDSWSIGASFRLVALLQVVASAGFAQLMILTCLGCQRRPGDDVWMRNFP